MATVVRLQDGQDSARPVGLEPLAGDHQAELIRR